MFDINMLSNSGYALPETIKQELITLFQSYGFTWSTIEEEVPLLTFEFENVQSALTGPNREFNPAKVGG